MFLTRGVWLGAVLATLVLSGCGSSRPAAAPSCPDVVASTLGHVAERLYRESVTSDVTKVARRLVERSAPLRDAVMLGDRRQAALAARRLIATRHMVRVQVRQGGEVLADVGSPLALSPLRGVLRDAIGRPIGSYAVSTLSASAYVSGVQGLTLAPAVITAAGGVVAASAQAAELVPPARGAFPARGRKLANFSFPALAFPSGALSIHVLPSYTFAAQNCGASTRDTVRQLIGGALRRIYDFETASGSTLAQVHRVQRDAPLLAAVASHDRGATRRAIIALLNQHIVRLRASDDTGLLADVGGPYVLAPVAGQLRRGGRTIGRYVLSIQDDLGYVLLSRRLANALVVLRTGGRVVMSAVRSPPATLPSQGPLLLGGHDYEAFSFAAQAFPSGPLQVFALIPIPYR